MKAQAAILSSCIFLLFSCTSSNKTAGDFKLLPQPQHFEITGSSVLNSRDIIHYHALGETDLPVRGEILKNIQATDNPSEAQILYDIDESLDIKAEGYTLNIIKDRIRISARDEAGLLYAFMTLEQLMEDAQEQAVPLPLCNIKDFPLLSYRAIHIDVKHHREKIEYYYKLMDKLAGYKVNAIIAEMEDKLKYERQPAVGSADALSIDEWKKLGEYAMKRNIEISPLIQGLGHASFILKHDIYKDLRDDLQSDWAFNPLNPETYDVQFDLYLDAIDATPHGRYLHVGGDEVHTTGRGSGMSALDLQMIWLDKVCRFAEEHGRIPIFWDDMPLKYANVYRPIYNTELTEEEVLQLWEENEPTLLEFLDRFPKNCIYMRWNYSTPQTVGNSKAMTWFKENGLKVMGATAGQTRWVLMPRNQSNMNNIESFAQISIDNELDGLLLTLWDDDSPHFELYKRGIIAFAEYTWTGLKRTKEEIKAAYRQREFSFELSPDEYAFIDQLEKPVAFWDNALLKENNRNYIKEMESPSEAVIDLPDKSNKGAWSDKHAALLKQAEIMLQDCDSIDLKIRTMQSHAVRGQYTLRIYKQVNKMAGFSPEALLALGAYDAAQNEQEESAALNKLRKLPEDFNTIRKELEEIYGETRILIKPQDYILDQDHHHHLANQSRTFDWQFMAEILFLEKLQKVLL